MIPQGQRQWRCWGLPGKVKLKMAALHLKAVLGRGVDSGIVPQPEDLLNRTLVESSVLPGENPRKGQAVDVPQGAGGTGSLLGVVHPGHPAGEDSSALVVQKCLRGVEIKAAVEPPPRSSRGKDPRLPVKPSGDIGGVAVHDLPRAGGVRFPRLGAAYQDKNWKPE